MARVFLLVALLAAPVAGAVQQAPRLTLVDDRGRAIASAVEVCWVLARGMDCRRVEGAAELQVPLEFLELRVEGADHGPVRLRRAELAVRADGSLRGVVPRKALLVVRRKAPEDVARGALGEGAALTVSLYSSTDASFREPMFRARLTAGIEQVKIPAGDFVASLSTPEHAPDLQRLTARPAARVELMYRQLPGWSLVVRCRDGAAGRRPLAQARVTVSAAPGFGHADTPVAVQRSAADGLALVSGITAPVAAVEAAHAELLSASVRGMVAAAGTFTVQDLVLLAGGRVRAAVTHQGRPVTAATCRLYEVESLSPPRERQLWSGEVDPHGACRSAPQAAGVYKLAVQMQGGKAAVFRWVSIEPGQESQEDVTVSPCHVHGRLERAGQPAAGYRVTAQPSMADAPMGSPSGLADEAVSDDDGSYQLTMWEPGRYLLHVRKPDNTPVNARKVVDLAADEDQEVDISLHAGGVSGTVVDEQGRGLARSWVWVTFGEMATRVFADDQGAFSLDLEGTGTARLVAGRSGYLRGAPIDVTVTADQPAVATLALQRDATARGAVLTAAGVPVAGAMIASLEADAAGVPRLYASTRAGDDGTFEVRVPPGVPRLFVSGPDCPLSAMVLPLAARSDADAGGDGDPDPAGEADADTDTDSDTAAAPPPSELRCPPAPASIQLTVADAQGRPVTHSALLLRQDGAIIPQAILAMHLALVGVPAETDGGGQIVLADLAPGAYDLYLTTASSAETIAAGLPNGFLTSLVLAPLSSSELHATIPSPSGP